jgi:tetratricopeptide (TPR) repeat protein
MNESTALRAFREKIAGYSEEQLRDVLRSLNRERFPERYRIVLELLGETGNATPARPSPPAAEDLPPPRAAKKEDTLPGPLVTLCANLARLLMAWAGFPVRFVRNRVNSLKRWLSLRRARAAAVRKRSGKARSGAGSAQSGFDTENSWNILNARLFSLFEKGRYDDAFPKAVNALEIANKIFPETDPRRAQSHNNLGAVCRQLKRYAEAEEHYRRALDIWDRTLDPSAREIAAVLGNLCEVLEARGDTAEKNRLEWRLEKIRESGGGG